MTGKKFIITCPICGKTLLKSSRVSNIEVQCPKCHTEFDIIHEKNNLSVRENAKISYTVKTTDEE